MKDLVYILPVMDLAEHYKTMTKKGQTIRNFYIDETFNGFTVEFSWNRRLHFLRLWETMTLGNYVQQKSKL